jgi:toxin ParE1/3/4
MPLDVRRLAAARADELDIWLHIAADSVSAADRTLDQLAEAVAMLRDFPDAGQARPELAQELRSYAAGAYTIFYRHDGKVLRIVRIISQHRDISAQSFPDR